MTRSTSKIPLRGIASLFNHLDPGIKAKIVSAFAEAEDLMDYHNTSIIDRQERRRISGLIEAPIVTLTTNSKGFDASWERLSDRRISFYEVQMSLTSNFADPTVFNVVETSLAVEGIGSQVYIRVRGVRYDGNCGPWSETETVDTSSIGGPVVYSRGMSHVPDFYIADPSLPYPRSIQRLRITPSRQSGGFLIYGSFGVDSFSNPVEPPVVVTLNGATYISVSSAEMQAATSAASTPVPFGLGPIFVGHDEFYFGESQIKSPGTAENQGSYDIQQGGVPSGWTTASPYEFSVTWTGAHSQASGTSKNLDLTNFGFTIPTGNTITGIKLSWTASDNNYETGTYDSAVLLGLRLLDDTGAARSNVVSGTGLWGNSAQSFGGQTNLWGEAAGFWTPAKVNDTNFGVRVRGKVFVPSTSSAVAVMTRTITMSAVTMTVYSANETTGEVDIQIRYNVGASGTLNQCTLNAIEFGTAL